MSVPWHANSPKFQFGGLLSFEISYQSCGCSRHLSTHSPWRPPCHLHDYLHYSCSFYGTARMQMRFSCRGLSTWKYEDQTRVYAHTISAEMMGAEERNASALIHVRNFILCHHVEHQEGRRCVREVAGAKEVTWSTSVLKACDKGPRLTIIIVTKTSTADTVKLYGMRHIASANSHAVRHWVLQYTQDCTWVQL